MNAPAVRGRLRRLTAHLRTGFWHWIVTVQLIFISAALGWLAAGLVVR